ncbi:MAG: class I SAM-dependent methyltransferase [Parvibaculum sp.]|uniref:class I SAM-dependent methyltransferase n=1 Tax=Parvibaculum sp. TaxID=2024848 RepID=UPI0025DC9344|nr:class I SAM-dependent methyltransferase [Parvibaculum sp.]MCE9648977.1 class I SAM-dependent methyltransferase [Parvibaculum sp.]
MASTAALAASPVEREVHSFNITWGFHGLLQLISRHHDDFETVLDIGSGPGEHSRFFRLFGKKVFSLDLHESADYVGDFMTYDFDRKFDVIWCSHVLEHQRNVGAFLDRIFSLLNDDGILAISLPVHPRSRTVSGHLTNWNAGLLIYNLILAGFDCREASFVQDYDLSLLVRKRPSCGGDVGAVAAYAKIEEVAEFFPFPVKESGDMEVKAVNWPTNYPLASLGRPVKLRFENKVTGLVEADLG